MRFPSIAQLQKEGTSAATRFPSSLFFGFLASALGCWIIEMEPVQDLRMLNLLLTFALGIPLYFCIDVLVESKKAKVWQRQVSWIIGLVFLGTIYMSFPTEETFTNTRAPYIRYSIFNLTIHLMVAFVPFIGNAGQESFWNYNKDLFIRLVHGVYYSLVIFLGISLALLAINALFEADIQGGTYAQIFVIIFGVFNTWFFLAGIPKSFDHTLSLDGYPKGLKIFTQFILIPLLLIYLCILYFYGAKIIISGDWPKGIVSYMIIAISVLGIFTNLLLYPYQRWKEGGWIKKFHKGYYLFLIPLIILLFLAIGIRLQDYGLTVNRYIIMLMGIWLAFVSIYYSVGKKNIKTIPISLAILMILSSFGPWGMFGLSETMQRRRLAQILTENNILVKDKIQNEVKWVIGENGSLKPVGELRTISIPIKDLHEINSILEYLGGFHGLEKVYPWFEQDLKTLVKRSESSKAHINVNPNKLLVESMNLTYVPYYDRLGSSEKYKELTLIGQNDFQLTISGFDYLRHITVGSWNTRQKAFSELKYHLEVDRDNKTNLILTWADGSMNIDISTYLKDLLNLYNSGFHNVPSEELIISGKEEKLEIKIQISSMTIANEEGKPMLQNLDGYLLVREIEKE
ncbi:DUF4153 domain-containing protein [Algoriphagus sp. AGSA1]|uniref:DUF4153 domain-containing protein n=1 Tax=Algoriphagus sp. AGSA1 TaxID=2907213 RepID=UPI001F2CDD0E|nr:DUF4153 domain-containing protein [Algoriphagus sp. AGSA1]MCE7053975.1 DUF4153 domain-containing protein [Algoriphagus sp. AGSA1]